MGLMDLNDADVFCRILASRGVRPRVYHRNIEAIAAVDLLCSIEDMAHRVVILKRSGRLPAAQAEAMLEALAECYGDPLDSAGRIVRISIELRCYDP